MLGGGGPVAVKVYASAGEGWSDGSGTNGTGHVLSAGMATIDCPDVGSRLTVVPEAVRYDVDRELALPDRQTADAYRQLQQPGQATAQDSASRDDTIMNPPVQATSAVYVPPTAAAQSQPQGKQGALAGTGTQLWPAAPGTLLAVSGLIMLGDVEPDGQFTVRTGRAGRSAARRRRSAASAAATTAPPERTPL